jgi:hypothetical protein
MRHLALLLLALSLTACPTGRSGGGGGGGGGGDDDDDLGGDACAAFLECVGAVAPEAHEALYDQYGPAGSCWDSGGDAQEICLAACEQQLDAYDNSFEEPACRLRPWPYSGDSVDGGDNWDPGGLLGDVVGVDQYGQAMDLDWLEGSWLLLVFSNNSSYWAQSSLAGGASELQAELDIAFSDGLRMVLCPFMDEGTPATDVAEDYGLNDLPVVADLSLNERYDSSDLGTFPGPFLLVDPGLEIVDRIDLDYLLDSGDQVDVPYLEQWVEPWVE